MTILRLILGSLLLGSSVTAQAQSAVPVPAPHFYGGLGVYTSSHHNLSSWGTDGTRIPVQAVVGYQLRPRLAVQLGLAYSGNRDTYDYQYIYSDPGTSTTYAAGTYTERSTTTSLLVRYTLTRKLQHRFQADLLGGVKVEHSFFGNAGAYFNNSQALPTPFDYSSSYNSTLLSLGASLRYRVVSRLEAVYDLTFDLPVAGGKYSNSIYSPKRRTQATMALGLRYRFGSS
jgi:hypothetical protein